MTSALCALLVALLALAAMAIHSTSAATDGAEVVEAQFAEQVKSSSALATAFENYSIASDRFRATDPDRIRGYDIELAESDTQLAQQIASSTDGHEGGEP